MVDIYDDEFCGCCGAEIAWDFASLSDLDYEEDDLFWGDVARQLEKQLPTYLQKARFHRLHGLSTLILNDEQYPHLAPVFTKHGFTELMNVKSPKTGAQLYLFARDLTTVEKVEDEVKGARFG